MNETQTFNNVWDALEDDAAERESLKIKSRMMMEIGQHLKEHKLTQTQAAKMMHVTQPRISDLINGKIDKFTIDMLITMLARLGLHVEVTLKAA
jgi:predicted XRE-type DNA-binding protein